MHFLNSIFTEHAQRRSISAAQNPFFCGMKARFTIRSKSLGRATTLRLLWDCVGVLENCAMHFLRCPENKFSGMDAAAAAASMTGLTEFL